MPSLKELRNRIASVTATRKITRAMQMVSAAKLRRAQDAAEDARCYAAHMRSVLAHVTPRLEGRADAHPLMVGTGAEQTHLLLLCTAERGLCGAFNTNIVRLACEHAGRLLDEGKTVKIMCVGKKGYDQIRRRFPKHIMDMVDLRGTRRIAFDDARHLSQKVLALFHKREFDVCTLFYARFRSVIAQVPVARQLVPFAIDDRDASDSDVEQNTVSAVHEYEPGDAGILSSILPRNVAVQIFHALLENAASEQGARMSAMDSATRNAGEMIDKLTLTYNRQRQAQITKELIEIVSGAEAL